MDFRIKELRDTNRMSQDELATRSGVSRAIISNLETGTRGNPTMETLSKIATALGVCVADLFSEETV